MDLRVNMRLLDIAKKISEGKAGEINYVNFEPFKKQYDFTWQDREKLPRSTPEKQGLSSEFLEEFIKEIINTPETCVHSMMIMRNGHVVAEGSFAPYKEEVWHVSNSLCKSITSLAIGIAIGDGKLKVTDSVVELLKNRDLPITAKLKKNIQVKHLLIMSSGLGANEAVAATENDWTKVMLESNQLFTPGTHFHYNSMNTYLLAAIIKEVTGEEIMDYLKPRIFEPLGIENLAWGKSPEGISKGGWGMFIRVEDMAKLGQLCLQKGMWKGKQLVPADYISEMAKYRIDSKCGKGEYGYGYQVWLGKRQGSLIFNGMFGQIVYVIPDLDMVFALTGGSDNLYRDNATNFLIEKYFDKNLPDGEIKENPAAVKRLRKLCENLEYKDAAEIYAEKVGFKPARISATKMREEALKFCNKKYRIPGASIGLMPMYMQFMNNNLSAGIDEMELISTHSEIWLVTKEGENENHIPVGFEKPVYSVIKEKGEEFNIATSAHFCLNEDMIPVLKIKMVYIEAENYRTITFYFDKKNTWAEFNENPGVDMMLYGMDSYVPNFGPAGNLINNTMEKLDTALLGYGLKYMVNPKVTLEEIND